MSCRRRICEEGWTTSSVSTLWRGVEERSCGGECEKREEKEVPDQSVNEDDGGDMLEQNAEK
jgi:hypothetical protein